jgi:hypothetical protein
MIAEAGFEVNHRKSKIVDTDHGTVFITKVGLENRDGKHVLVFPKEEALSLGGTHPDPSARTSTRLSRKWWQVCR